MIEIFNRSIKKPFNKVVPKIKKDASLLNSYYTGYGLDSILTEYRQKETTPQKNQRKRITISRSKSLIAQIENVFNQLALMDKPAINAISKSDNEKVVDDVLSWIYNKNINQAAFDIVKVYNLIDANAFVVASSTNGEVIFKIYPSEMIHDYECDFSGIKWVIFKLKYNDRDKYVMYHPEGIIDDGEEIKTNMMYCFPVGINKDGATSFNSYKSFLDSSSDSLKSLLWQGSELDTIKATHGIIKEYHYEDRCNFRGVTEENESVYCDGGYLSNGQICGTCEGTGLKIHRSSQDVLTYPMPMDAQSTIGLDKMHHIVQVDTQFMEFLKADIEDIKHEIIRSVFNASTLTKDKINETATGEMIDLQGIYATLSILGQGVSNLFIWMCEIYCDVKGYKDVSILHGYTLSLKLESVESLADKRAKLLDANAPQMLVKAVDMAILQKQHADSPQMIDKFSIWEKYRPFNDKSPSEIQFILSALPNTNYYKILYMFFGIIKTNIEQKIGNQFYQLNHDRRLKLINDEVEVIRDQIEADQTITNPFDIE